MITVTNISKKYKDAQAIENIGFELKAGELVGFLGANGAGKSTTMKILTGVLQPDSGTVEVFGCNIEREPLAAKKRIGYLSEDNLLPTDMYVREYLEYVAELYRLQNIRERIDEAILKFGLKNEYRKKIHALSKGNRQKLGLAQALLHDPDFVVLDEPASALDPNQQQEIKEIITGLGKSKIVLFSTHILSEAAQIASRIIVLKNGRLALDEDIKNITSIETLFYTISHEDSCR
ncbi:MAG: ABC transporter ATP-binding protein [Prevotella sp.]|jgi:ABC-2 type transport system ATP-binding protein|nr:ABC transporter ATP-binding protein [Prevotella sp.]